MASEPDPSGIESLCPLLFILGSNKKPRSNTCYQESAPFLMIRSLALENDLSFVRKWRVTMEGKKSKRGRVGEGRPTKRTPEAVAKIAEAVAIGLTDREAGLLAGIRHDTMTEWHKDPEFSEAIERATAQRL